MSTLPDGIDTFLGAAGWAGAQIAPLTGDASFRRYFRVHHEGRSAMLMHAPPPEEPRVFLHVGRWLIDQQIRVPLIYAEDLDKGWVLIEDFGDARMRDWLDENPQGEEEAYAGAIDALVDLHRDRGYFRYQIADFDGALEDYGAAVDGDPSASSYNSRAWVRLQLGDNEGVLSDIEAAAELDPEYGLAEPRLIALGLLGRGDETVALVDEYEVFLEDASVRTQHRAYALGGAGEIDEGRALLEEELEFTPGDADLLNASCWYDGIWDRVTEETIDRFTRAIEGLDNSLEALDSRALALFRLGRNDEALRDLDRVLTIDPEMDGSRYLRGVIRSHSGDAAGAREDIEIVRWASPYTPRQYALWGLEPA